MLYLRHVPARPLSDFVADMWLCNDAPAHRAERILPSGTIEMVFNLAHDELRIGDPTRPDPCLRFVGALVSGTYTRAFVVDARQHASIIGVHFKPGGAFPFLGMPALVLADSHVALDALWGRKAGELRERLCVAALPAQRFRILEEMLIAQLKPPPRRHAAVQLALAALGNGNAGTSIAALARDAGLSHRRFIEVFAAEVGLTPKTFSRVRRFQRARAELRRMPTPDWAHLALAAGYFDQSHLIRDFRQFSGLTPTAYHRHKSERVLRNHVPIVDAL